MLNGKYTLALHPYGFECIKGTSIAQSVERLTPVQMVASSSSTAGKLTFHPSVGGQNEYLADDGNCQNVCIPNTFNVPTG